MTRACCFLAGFLAACFEPRYAPGIACGEQQSCPPGFTCGPDGTCGGASAAPATYTIGGTVTGLAGSGLRLQLDGGDSLAIAGDGRFAFATPVASGARYDVRVETQPSSPAQTCTVAGGTGTVGAADVESVTVDCAVHRFTVGGRVDGLADGNTLAVLLDAEALTLRGSGEFRFPTARPTGTQYLVVLGPPPSGPVPQTCEISGERGWVEDVDVTTVRIVCTVARYPIHVDVSGVVGPGLVLQNLGGDDLPIDRNGRATFATPVAFGAPYAVTVRSQPTDRFCRVEDGPGIVGREPIIVVVTCSEWCFTFRNDGGENLIGNDWLDACVGATGSLVDVELRDEEEDFLVYRGTGAKIGAWTPDAITSTAPPELQFDSILHDRAVTLDNGDRLVIAARNSRGHDCRRSLGNGYVVAIYSPVDAANPKILVAPYRHAFPAEDRPPQRDIAGWTEGHEISWNLRPPHMDTCTEVRSFTGTFSMRVREPAKP